MKSNKIVQMSILLGLMATWLVAGSCGSTSEADAPNGSVQDAVHVERSPNAMPNFTLADLDGNTVNLTDYAGKAVLVNFWATWCGPCKAELPDLVEFQNEYGGENFTIVGISMDQIGPAAVKKFAQQWGLNYPIVMGNLDVVAAYGNFRGIPATFLLNSRHEKVKQYIGAVTKAQLTADLKSMIDESA